MSVQIFIKKFNDTELGKRNTNERYVRTPNHMHFILDWKKEDADKDGYINFIEKKTSNIVKIKCSIDREERLVSTKGYFNDLRKFNAGDKIAFERRVNKNDSNEFYIDYVKSNNLVLLLKKGKKGLNQFDVMNIERLDIFKQASGLYEIPVIFNGESKQLFIEFSERIKLKKNSPKEIDVYSIYFKDGSYSGKFEYLRYDKDYLELIILGNKNIFYEPTMFQYYEFEQIESENQSLIDRTDEFDESIEIDNES